MRKRPTIGESGRCVVVPLRGMILLLAETVALAATASAQCAHRDTTRTNLSGRTETATIWILTSADSVGGHWKAATDPAPIGTSAPACIRVSLEVRLGGATIPAGQYQLLAVAADTITEIILRGVTESGDPPTTQAEYRIPVRVVYGAPLPFVDIRVRTVRRGPDTVGVVDRSTRQKGITELQLLPGTTSVLLIRLGDATLSLPISAR